MCKNVLAEIWWQSLARFCGRFTILISPARPIYERERERVSCPSPLEGERTRTYERDFRSLELSATFLTRPRFLDSREYRTRATSTCIGRRSSSHFISRTLTSSIYLYNRVCRFIMHGELMYRTRARRSSRRERERERERKGTLLGCLWVCVSRVWRLPILTPRRWQEERAFFTIEIVSASFCARAFSPRPSEFR